jgi:hypothetical protein
MPKPTHLAFNVKNVKFAVETTPGSGTWGAPQDLALADALTLEADYSEQVIYGDGKPQAVIADDRGMTGNLITTAINPTYEIAMKRALEIEGGLADVQQSGTVKHCLYYEVEVQDTSGIKTIKAWLFGVYSGKPSETYNQTKEDPTINFYEHSLKIHGTKLQNALGTDDYVDANGNTLIVTRLVAWPEDTGYATFGDTVPTPTALT